MLHERIYLDNSDELAYIDTYVSDLPHGGPRDAMIVFPGGGYRNVCADREGEAIAEALEKEGFTISNHNNKCDIYIINTCTVTALSDRKSRNAARRCKKINPNARLVLCGCYAQVKSEEAREACGADAVIGTPDKSRIVAIVEELAQDGVRDLWHEAPPLFDLLPAGGLSGRTRALLKVQDGCQNFCTYCLIPFARGPERSMPFDLAVEEAEEGGFVHFSVSEGGDEGGGAALKEGRDMWIHDELLSGGCM